jgi:hypothetical protein
MITAADVRQRIQERPFRPFRVYLKDGRQFDVPDPFWTLVGEPVLILGVAAKDEPPSHIPDHSVWVDYRLIDRVELLPVETAAQ